ncbi:MAG: FG-GAP repeat domain-containing protein, partial [Flavobacteriales bacterium]
MEMNSVELNWRLLLISAPLLFCQPVVSQLVIDNGVAGLETDHTGGYLGTGMSFADFNGDGIDDLSFGHHNGELKFYQGTGNGFTVLDLDLSTPESQSKGIVWADVDNDGDQDLFVAFRLAPNKLWINQGDMVMLDVSETCGIAQDDRRSFGPAFGDFDRDGLLDLFVANYGYAVDVPQGNELYRNLGNGEFEDVTEAMGMGGDNLQSFQGNWMDIDRDGWLDLYVIRDRFIYPNLFYHNLGAEMGEASFEEEAEIRGLDIAINCMSSSPHDFDRDGDLDVFVSGGLEGNVLL